jgi:hypothetical protein
MTSPLNQRAIEYLKEYLSNLEEFTNLDKTERLRLLNEYIRDDPLITDDMTWLELHFSGRSYKTHTFEIKTSYEIIEAINYLIVLDKYYEFNSPDNNVESITMNYLREVLENLEDLNSIVV